MNLNALNTNDCSTYLGQKIVSMNIRSLRKHMVDLIKEPNIMESDVILVQQTCLKKDESTITYHLENYEVHFNSFGDGKGVALDYKENFEHIADICKENYQISKLQSEKYDIICVYRSSDSIKTNQMDFLNDLRSLICKNHKTIISGDFNFNALCSKQNYILKTLETWNFIQIVKEPTHILGGLIDHCYMSNNISKSLVSFIQKSVYYTDHDVNEIIIRET